MRLPILTLTALAAAASAQAEIVFGNLGADGTGGRDDTNTDVTSTNRLAVGFNVGFSQYQYLQSISIYAFAGETGDYSLSLYTGNVPNFSASPFAISSALSLEVNTTGLYEFNFEGVTLIPNASYWVVAPVPLSWYITAGEVAATPLNSSGYFANGNLRSTNSGSTWTSTSFPYTISVEATNVVPEPSTYGMILGGLALVGAAVRRRRKSA